MGQPVTASPVPAPPASGRLRRIAGRAAVLLRVQGWFFPKLPPLLAVGYAQVLLTGAPLGSALRNWLLTVATIFCLAAYGHVVNDLSDLESDRRAGKPNSLERLSPAARIWVCALVAVVGLSALFVLPGAAAAVLMADYVLATAYSLRPVRLKERGVLGALTDATAVHALPTLYVVFLFAGAGPRPPATAALAIVAPLWAFLLGLRGITSHQVWDYDNDLRSDTRTLVTRVGSDRARSVIRWILFPAEIVAFLAVLAIVGPYAPAVVALVAAYALLDVLRWRVWRISLDPAPAAMGRYIPPADLYQAWFPLGLAVQLAVRDLAFAVIPLLHVALFFDPLKLQAREAARLLADAARMALRRVASPRPPTAAPGA